MRPEGAKRPRASAMFEAISHTKRTITIIIILRYYGSVNEAFSSALTEVM